MTRCHGNHPQASRLREPWGWLVPPGAPGVLWLAGVEGWIWDWPGPGAGPSASCSEAGSVRYPSPPYLPAPRPAAVAWYLVRLSWAPQSEDRAAGAGRRESGPSLAVHWLCDLRQVAWPLCAWVPHWSGPAVRRGRLPQARCCWNSLERTRRPLWPKGHSAQLPGPPVCPLSLCLRQGHRGPCEVEEVVWGPESSPLSLKKGKLRPREGWRVSGGQKRPSLGSESAPSLPPGS